MRIFTLMRSLLLLSAALLVAGCGISSVNVQNSASDIVIVRADIGGEGEDPEYQFYVIPVGERVNLATTAGPADIKPYARHLWIMSVECQLLAETEVDYSSEPPSGGTFIVGDGPTVTFDPNMRIPGELSFGYTTDTAPCP